MRTPVICLDNREASAVGARQTAKVRTTGRFGDDNAEYAKKRMDQLAKPLSRNHEGEKGNRKLKRENRERETGKNESGKTNRVGHEFTRAATRL
jgi:hypothetical protein